MVFKIGVSFLKPAVIARLRHDSLNRTSDAYKRADRFAGRGARFVVYDGRSSLREFVAGVDAIVATFDPRILRARNETSPGKPILWEVLGEASHGYPFDSRFLSELGERDRLLCSCEADRRILSKFIEGPNDSSVVVLPSLVDTGGFDAAEVSEQECRSSLGLPPTTPLIVYAGRITPQKNLETLLLFGRYARLRSGRDVKLVVAGGEDVYGSPQLGVSGEHYRQHLDRIVAGDPHADKPMWLGRLDATNLRMLYRAATVVVNPTCLHDESFGVGQVEAMASGTPVIASSWGGVRDTVVANDGGFAMPTRLLPDGGVVVDWRGGALYAAELIRHPEMYRAQAEVARRRVARVFSLAAVVPRLVEAARAAGQMPVEGRTWTAVPAALEFVRRVGYRSNYMSSPDADAMSLYRMIFGEYASAKDRPAYPSAVYRCAPIERVGESIVERSTYLWGKQLPAKPTALDRLDQMTPGELVAMDNLETQVAEDVCELADAGILWAM